MSQKYIPNGDLAFASMARAFARGVTRSAELFGISEQDCALLDRRVREYRDALAAATNSRTRTPEAVFIKSQKRREAEALVRRIANTIRHDARLSDADKLKVGIRRRPARLKRRTVPLAPPELSYLGPPRNAGPNCQLHVLSYREAEQFAQRSKPNGASRIELFVDLVLPGHPIPQYPGEYLNGRAWYIQSFSRSPFKVKHPIPPVPMRVVYWARWADAQGKFGGFSRTCVAGLVGWPGAGADPLLGPLPDVRQLMNDPKHITILQLQQPEETSPPRMLPPAQPNALPQPAPEQKQLPLDEAA